MTTSDNRQQLIAKLKELFQMDQADLDFGIYRIMNTKRDEITRFLEQDLMPTLRSTLEKFQPAGQAEKQAALEEAIKAAHTAGFDPEQSPKVQQLRAELSQSVDLETEEETIYSDLTTFFSRYYQGGDFMSLRRYKEGVYALPYEGEEVKLHWANADQYYIKTAENFTRYAFKTPQGRVRFELIAASTERDNVKASAENERRFILAEHPLAEENGELVIYFEFRPDPDKRKQKELNTLAVSSLLALPAGAPLTQGIQQWAGWQQGLASIADPEKNKSRSLLEKHLSDYTAKNTFDYFIHKDLGKFLRRELDFFIKNEVMHLDDIEDETAPKVEQYLARIKAMRQIAHKIIAFLAQLENFQKKLWLKKKFVLETQWLITLDRIDESFYPEICEQAEKPVRGWDGKTRSQRELWAELIGSEALRAADALTPDLLKQHPFLMLDTAFLGDDLKIRLMSSFTNLEAETNGVLIHGENFQALNLLQARYHEQVRSIYIDPPYNTGGDDFIYRDAYQHSSWVSFLADRLKLGKALQPKEGTITVSIDDDEMHRLAELLDLTYGDNELAKLVWDRNRKNDARYFSVGHEYMLVWAKSRETLGAQGIKFREPKEGLDDAKRVFAKLCKEHGENWEAIRDGWKAWFDNIPVADPRRRLMRYNKIDGRGPFRDDGNINWPGGGGPRYEVLHPDTKLPCKIPRSGWRYPTPERFWEEYEKGRIGFGADETTVPSVVTRLFEDGNDQVMPSVFYSYAQTASQQFDALFGKKVFDNPKHWPDLLRVLRYVTPEAGTIMDYFAGTGSTAHALIDLNRIGFTGRDYVLVEMGEHFDTVLRPRIQKAVYASSWSDGQPQTSDGISQLIKYLRIESYEDASNNLGKLEPTAPQAALLEKKPSLREGYVLHYMLDIESRQQLLDLGKFADPFSIEMTIVRHDDVKKIKVDVIETFNYLLGLRIETLRRIKGIHEVIGTMPNGDRTLILWRNTLETNNDALDEWFRKQAYNSRDREFDLIYVNGDNNLENLRRPDESWKVRLIEETFQTLMFDVQDV